MKPDTGRCYSSCDTTEKAATIGVLPLVDLLSPPSEDCCIRVYVIRHGQTDWNRQGRIQGGSYDVPLNATGRLQARCAGEAFQGIHLDLVASSPLKRAFETATIIRNCTACSAEVVISEGFREMRYGAFEGLRYRSPKKELPLDQKRLEELKIVKRRMDQDPDYPFPDTVDGKKRVLPEDDECYRLADEGGPVGESIKNVQERSLQALSAVVDTTKRSIPSTATKHVAIVAHGRTNKILIAVMLHGQAHGRFREIKQDNVNISVLDLLEVPPNGADTIETLGRWTARLLNHTQHTERINEE